MKGRMLFIFNPRSGKGQIRNKLMDIIDVFVKGGYEVVVHPTQGAKDAEKMAKIMAEEVDLIVCSGGDGTLDEVVTGLMEIGASVPLGYIPAGSTNDFANSLEISRDMVKAAQDIVDGHLFSVDVGSFNEDPDTFCHLSYRRKRISVLQSGCRDSQYDLVAKLHINRFFTVKVYLQQFYLHLFTLLSLFCVLFII